MSVQPRRDVAVFIDFENIYVSVRDKLDANPNFEIIMDHCNQLGRVILARAYADWYRYPRITSALYANNIEPMYVPTYYYDKGAGRTGGPIKNSVDMNLCIDAMRTLFTMPALSTFVLITGDRDFIPLVNSIRQQGKDVIIIGVGGAASSHLAQSADEFLFYEQMVGKAELANPKPEPRRIADPEEYERPVVARERISARGRSDRRDAEPRPSTPPVAAGLTEDGAFALLAKAVLEARVRNMVTGIGSLKTLIRELSNGEFRESVVRDANGRPIPSFKEFINEAARRGKIFISTEGVVNEVFLPGEDPKALSQFSTTESSGDKKDDETPVSAEDRAAAAFSSANGDKNRRRRRRGGERTPTGRSDSAASTSDSSSTDDELALPITVPPAAPVAIDTPVRVMPQDDSEGGDTAVAIPFSDEERQSVRDIVSASERPLSFQQIYDILRGTRNRGGEQTIARTNEDLRSLVKLAINTGELQRIGRGNRITYRIAPSTSEETEASGSEPTPVVPVVVDEPVRSEPVMIPTPADHGDDGLTPPVPAVPAGRRRVKQQPVAAAVPAPVAPEATVTELTPPTQPRRRGPKPKNAQNGQSSQSTAPAAAPAPARPAGRANQPAAKPARTERPAEGSARGGRGPKRTNGAANTPAPIPTPAADLAPVAPNKPRRRTQKPE